MINLSAALSLLLTFSLFSLRTATAAPFFLFILCQNTTNTYSPNSTYESNLNALFPVLSSNATAVNGFYNYTAGRTPPDVAYGLFLCRGDVSLDVCRDCVSTATKEVVPKCPRQKEVTIWYDECMLRYSNQSIFGVSQWDFARILRNTQNVTDPTQNVTDPNRFREVMGVAMSDVVNRAVNSQTGKKFATREANFTALQTLYWLGQCTPDLTAFSCDGCLQIAINTFPNCCDLNQGARILSPSCNVRYELYPFYNVTATVVAPPPSGKGRLSSRVLTAIIVPVGVSVLLFIVGICLISRKAKKHDIIQEDIDNDFTTARSLQYDLGTIQAATNNFSDENKIGEGGYGPVYKGTLTDGKEIAVKRLSRNSGQGAVEFKNEVLLVAKLEHRNLVRLLRFCLEREEKILIYELVPNKSLDYFLFDPQGQERLDWSRRYKIIGGIARGMLYLHEDSRLRIIHRDLKASNVLLDRDMNAKISDFGMARIVNVDQTRGTTSRVVGTFGYMSPEYVMHGQFSVKSDVFSFGILVLEIICGKKNNSFFLPDSSEYLLSYAWKLWREETPLDLLDPTLERSYSRSEVIRCIHIGLLCVQEDPDARPSMATVVLMLNSYPVTMSVPQQPAFFHRSRTDRPSIPKGLLSDQSTSKLIPFSMNEASITELYPR